MPKQPKVKSNDPNRIDSRKKKTSAFSSVAGGGTVETGMEFTPANPNLVQNNTGMDTLQVGKTYNPIGQVAAGTELANLLNAGMGAATAAAKGYGYVNEKEEREREEQEANFEALQKKLAQNKIDKVKQDQEHDEGLEFEFRSAVLELEKRISENPGEYNATRRHEELSKIYAQYPETSFRTDEGRLTFEENRTKHSFQRGEAQSVDWYHENVDRRINEIRASSLPDYEKAHLIAQVVDRAIDMAEGDKELLADFPMLKTNLQAKLGKTADAANGQVQAHADNLVREMGPKLKDAYDLWLTTVQDVEDPLQDFPGSPEDKVGALVDQLMESAGLDLAMLPDENEVREQARKQMQVRIEQVRDQVRELNHNAVKNKLEGQARADVIVMQSPDFSLERAAMSDFDAMAGRIGELRDMGELASSRIAFENTFSEVVRVASTQTIDFGGIEPEERRAHAHAALGHMVSTAGIVVASDPETGKLIVENSGLPQEDQNMIKAMQVLIDRTDFDVIGQAIAKRSVEELWEASQNAKLPIHEQRVVAAAYAKQVVLDAGQVIANGLITGLEVNSNVLVKDYLPFMKNLRQGQQRAIPSINLENSAERFRLSSILDGAIANMDQGETLLDSLRTEVKDFYARTDVDEQGDLANFGPALLESYLEMAITGDEKLGRLLMAADTVLNKGMDVGTSATDMGKLKDSVEAAGGQVNKDGNGFTFDTDTPEMKVLRAFGAAEKNPNASSDLPNSFLDQRSRYYAEAQEGLGRFAEQVREKTPAVIHQQEMTFFMRMGNTLAPLLGQGPEYDGKKVKAIKGFLVSRYGGAPTDALAEQLLLALNPDGTSQANTEKILASTIRAVTDKAIANQTEVIRKGIIITGTPKNGVLKKGGDPLENMNPIFIRDLGQATSIGDTKLEGVGEIDIAEVEQVLSRRGMALAYRVKPSGGTEVLKRKADLDSKDIIVGYDTLPLMASVDDGNQIIAAASNDNTEFPLSLNINAEWSERINDYIETDSITERQLFEEQFENGEGAAIHEAWTRLMKDIASGNVDVLRDMKEVNISKRPGYSDDYYDQLRVYLFSGRGWNSRTKQKRGNLQLAHVALTHSMLRRGVLPLELINRGYYSTLTGSRGRRALYLNPEKAFRRGTDGEVMFHFGDENQMDSGIDIPSVWDMGNGFINDHHRGFIRGPHYTAPYPLYWPEEDK